VALTATANQLAVYLDNWAIGGLAEGDADRRTRFLNAINTGADLLFSVANAAELSGPQGKSADAIRSFLDEIGPRWYPVELGTVEIVKREANGASADAACFSRQFLQDYFEIRLRDYGPGIVDFNKILSLGSVLDWTGPQRDKIRTSNVELDNILRKWIELGVEETKKNKQWLEEKHPAIPFDPAKRCQFAYKNLIRILMRDGMPVAKNDGMDLSHAVVGTAFAHFAALDKRWKHRVARFPAPNDMARVYSGPLGLDALVSDLESKMHRAGLSSISQTV
jgi:hypothetical protein